MHTQLNPEKLEETAKKYSRSKKDKNAPEWRPYATPYFSRHWRHQVCQKLNIDKKDLPEEVTEALRAYLFPSAIDAKSQPSAWLVKVPNLSIARGKVSTIKSKVTTRTMKMGWISTRN